MGKIGDIFVRLGLKSEDYKKGIADAKKENASFATNVGKLKAGAIAAWAAVGTAVVGFAKEMVNASNTWGDKWSQTMTGAKSAWQTFLVSLQNWNWGNFWDRMSSSYKSARDAMRTYDAEFEVMNVIKLREGRMGEQIAQWEIDARDQTKSNEERIKAIDSIIAARDPLFDLEKRMRANNKSAALSKWLGSMGPEFNTAENAKLLEQFFRNYTGTPESVSGLKRTLFTDTEIGRIIDTKATAELSMLIDQFIKHYESESNDAFNSEVVQTINALDIVDSTRKSQTRRLRTLRSSLVKGTENESAPEGSIAYLEAELEKAKKAVLQATTDEARAVAQMLVDEIQKKIESADLWTRTQAAIKRGTFAEEFVGEIELPEDDKVDDIKIKDTKIEVPKLTEEMNGFTYSTMEGVNAVSMLAGAVGNLTGLVDSGASSWLTYGTNILQTVAQAIPAIASMTAAKKAEASANTAAAASGAGSAVAGIPVVGPAMAVASILSVIAAIASVPKFASGGIVGGHSYSGDRILARLNSGEMVLNQRQQSALLSELDRPAQRIEISGKLTADGRDLSYSFDKYSVYKRQ